MSEVQHEKSLALIERLIKSAPDAGSRKRFMKLRGHFSLPMKEVIAKIPPQGGSIIEKARTLGVSRQSLYSWLDGVCRPGPGRAKKIAKLTGLDADDVRGRPAA